MNIISWNYTPKPLRNGKYEVLLLFGHIGYDTYNVETHSWSKTNPVGWRIIG